MSSSPKVIFGPEIWGLQNDGGISRYFKELVTGLSDIGAGGRILTQNNKNSRLTTIATDRFKVQHLGDSTDTYSEISRILSNDPDTNIYHPTYYTRHLGRIRRPNTRVILTVHDMISELFPEKKKRFAKKIDEKKLSVDMADHIICVSNTTKNDLVNLYNVSQDRISVVLLGSNLGSLGISASFSSPKRSYLLYVGKRDGYKNFWNFVVGYARSKSLVSNFMIVAFGGGAFNSEEISKLKNLGIVDDVIQVTGSDEQLAMYYRNAACLVYPSLYEGFGLPPVEAMSLNCPVVASYGGSIREICKEASAYFDPTCIDSIQHALQETLGDQNRLNEMRIQGLKHVKSLTWEKTASATLSVYRQVLGN
jgi:glycosyltransferase involved in cell wall biosynthesis